MAIDKAIDSALLDGALKASADEIRAKTGESGKVSFDLSGGTGFKAAIAAIVAGGGNGLAYDMGEFMLEADVNTTSFTPSRGYVIPHKLGKVPDFILVWTDDFAGIAEAPYTSTTALGWLWMRELMGLTVRASSTADQSGPVFAYMSMLANSIKMQLLVPSSASYGLHEYPTETEFYGFTVGASTYFRGGVKYRYFVSEAWWNVGGVADAE